MSEFTVTSSEVTAKADELARLNQQLQQKIDALVQSDASLNGMWEGDAKDAFSNSFNVDKAKMTLFHAEIEKYIAALRVIAAKYADAEARNTQTAGSQT